MRKHKLHSFINVVIFISSVRQHDNTLYNLFLQCGMEADAGSVNVLSFLQEMFSRTDMCIMDFILISTVSE